MKRHALALVTGASGFIGLHLTRYLVDQGVQVWTYGRRASGCEHNAVKPVSGSIVDGEGLEEVPWEKLDYVFHLAASGVKAVRRVWHECVAVNILGTLRVLDYLERRSSKARLIYTRTFYELGITQTPSLCENPYVVTKQAATRSVEMWARRNSRRNVCVATIYQGYGAHDDSKNVLNYICSSLRSHEPVRLSNPALRRDWINVGDIVTCLSSMASSCEAGLNHYDVGTGTLTPLSTVANKLEALMGCTGSCIVFDPAMDRGDSGLELKAERFVPGWTPRISLDEGLARLIVETEAEDCQRGKEP